MCWPCNCRFSIPQLTIYYNTYSRSKNNNNNKCSDARFCANDNDTYSLDRYFPFISSDARPIEKQLTVRQIGKQTRSPFAFAFSRNQTLFAGEHGPFRLRPFAATGRAFTCERELFAAIGRLRRNMSSVPLLYPFRPPLFCSLSLSLSPIRSNRWQQFACESGAQLSSRRSIVT